MSEALHDNRLMCRPVSALPKKGEKRPRSPSLTEDAPVEIPDVVVPPGESSRAPTVTFDIRPPVIRKVTRSSPVRAEPEKKREAPRGAISMVESILEQQALKLFGTSLLTFSFAGG
jgi:hypothetical protein